MKEYKKLTLEEMKEMVKYKDEYGNIYQKKGKFARRLKDGDAYVLSGNIIFKIKEII